MADPVKRARTKEDEEVLKQARDSWNEWHEKEQKNVDLAYDDLVFLSGREYAQWPDDQRQKRVEKGRPVLQANQLPKFVHQITGDIRQMRPSIKVVPVDDGSDEKMADIYGGLIRYIENRSDASAIYFRTADSQVSCGIGHWRVMTEYADGSTFNQEIRIGPVEDGVSVAWDTNSVFPNKEDAEWCLVPIDMSRASFERAYPDISPDDFDDAKWPHNAEWTTGDKIRVAEYWVKKPTKKTLALFPDGRIDDVTDGDESALAFAMSRGARIETRESKKVVRYLITSSAVLEGPTDWPGRYIPIIPLVGEEFRIGPDVIRQGIVRNAKDAQRMLNYYYSMHTEVVALQPKSPYMVTAKNIQKWQDLWDSANTENTPYLVFDPDPANAGARPERIQPPVSSQGILEGLTLAEQNLKSIIGIYDAGLGQKSNETSGKAILARQREGDVGSFLYIDNFARAVRHTGNVIVDLIPHIYDTERTIRIMGEDGKVDVMEINKAQGIDPATGQTQFMNDVTTGSYDVVATTGPSYTTRREEARDGMMEFLKALPNAAPLIADKVAKAMDWPMADDIAKRIRATLPPGIIAMEEAEEKGMDPEEARAMAQQANQPPPDPQLIKVQLEAQNKQAEQQFNQQKAINDMQLEMRRMEEESRQANANLMAEIRKMFLDSQTKIEVAQINAGVGMHKNIVQAGVDEMKTQTSAAVEARKIESAAETARYAADTRPRPSERQ